jgi:isoquinoline 1-oxidoreductase beta subunit
VLLASIIFQKADITMPTPDRPNARRPNVLDPNVIDPNVRPSTPRRRFLLGGLGLAGALVIGWGVLPPRQRLTRTLATTVATTSLPAGAVELNGWIAIGADGIVSLAMPRNEMGQGVHTALPMLVAEELDVPLSMITLTQAPLDKIFGNLTLMREALPFHPDDDGNVKAATQWMLGKVAREMGITLTGGSSSVKDAWEPMREAGATARAQLLRAAAASWGVAPGECRTEAGFVLHVDGRRASYGSLAAQAAGERVARSDVVLKPVSQFKLIGSSAARRDTPAKVDGSAVFGIDARVPGMLYAAVAMAPEVGAGAGVVQFDVSSVSMMPGVLHVVDFSAALGQHFGARAGVAVVATSFWRAHQAVNALPVSWSASPHAKLSSQQIFADFARRLDVESGHTYFETGSQNTANEVINEATNEVVHAISAQYSAPFLAHAAMEPINCTAQVAAGKVTLWLSTQAPTLVANMAAKVAGVAATDVTIHQLLLGGGFGRRLETDMVAQAVAIALHSAGAPVQVIWTREQDMAHDVYRPAALARFSGSLDATGNVLAYDNKSISGAPSHQFFKRNLGLPGIGPDKAAAEGEYDMQYEIANQRIRHVIADSAVALGNWRSVGHSHNAFFKESFIDELAHASGLGSAQFRRRLLMRHPRHLAVLDAALLHAGVAPVGRAHGLALHQSFGTIVAQVAEVSVDMSRKVSPNGKHIRVHRVVCVLDCGIAVNPNIIAQQMESSVIFGLSAALHGAITLREGRIEQRNFDDYPVLRIDQAPIVETIIMASTAPPQGIGEPGTPVIAPAVANAVFALTGQRLRSLPLILA